MFPQPSFAVKVTVFAPTGNAAPDANPPVLVVDTVPTGQVEVPVGAVYVAIAVFAPLAAVTVILAGQLSVSVPVAEVVNFVVFELQPLAAPPELRGCTYQK